MNLQKKVSLFGGVGLLVIFGLLAFLGIRALEESTERTFNERVVTAQMVAQGVDQALREALENLERFAALGSVDLEDGDLSPEIDALRDLHQFSQVFSWVFLLDREGNVLYTQPEDPKLMERSLWNYPNVASTLKDGASHVSSALPADSSKRPGFSLSAALANKEGKITGLVGGDIDLSQYGLSALIQPIRLGKTAYAEIVSETGLVMASTKVGASSAFEETEYAEHFASLIERGEPAKETCYRCHETEESVERKRDVLAFAPLDSTIARGGVAIRQHEEEALAPTRRLERDMLLVGAPIFVLGLLLTWFGVRSLVRPIAQLTAASRRIAQGDLDTAIAQTRKDELGTLAQTFEQMRVRLKESLEEREERARESESRAQQLSALNAVAVTVSQSLELEQILEDSLNKVLETMHLEAGGIFLKEESGELVLKAHRGASPESLNRIAQLKTGSGFSGEMFPLEEKGSALEQGELLSFLNVPLMSRGKRLGSMVLASRQPRQFTSQEMELLTAIGHQIGVGIENAQLFRETQGREREAQALYGIGMEMSQLLNLDRILDSVVAYARQLLGADIAILSLLDEASSEIYVRATSGQISEALKRVRFRVGQGLAGKVISLGKPVTSEDYLADPTITHIPEADSSVREAGLRAHLSVPLKIGEKVLGSLGIADRYVHKFSDREIDLLSQLANQAAVAIENARLYNQVQDLAVLEERDRIAREMHDGLGQVLGYLNLKTRGVEDLLSSGQVASAQEEMREIRKVARDAYEEVRQGILGLRAKVASEAGLIPQLRDFLEGFQSQSGLPVTLTVEEEKATRFPSQVAVQLVRVVQEALTNVRKHAQATSADVRFEIEGDQAKITIEDDGVGFDPAQFGGRDRQRFGLQTMRERVEGVGGVFALDSRSSEGTRVIVRLPLSSEGGD